MELRQHPFYAAASPEQMAMMESVAQVESINADTVIFEEGSASDALFLLLEGEVAFCKRLPGEQVRAISYARPGDFFGEIGLFTGQPRALRAEARGRVRLARIPREALMEFIKSTPGPIDHILQSIISHLHATTRHYVTDMLRQEKMAMVGNMMNTIIHDFKNPFCLISLGAQLIAQKHQDEKTQKLCRNIEDQIQRMVAMAEELNEFSRGTQTLKISQVHLPALVERFQELNFPFFQHPRVKVETRIDDITLEAEEAKLLRVLQNLVGNAIDALDERGGRIIVAARRQGEEVLLTVEDNGNGIPEQIRSTFFEPFVTFGKSKGTGLGTAIVKSVVEAHGGRIHFDTETGVGTKFFVHLPTSRSGKQTVAA